MRIGSLLAVALATLLVPTVAAASGDGAPAAAQPHRAAACASPSLLYRGVGYRVVHLRAHRTELGLRLRRPLVRDVGVLTSHTECRDVVICGLGQPCEPPPASPATVSSVRVLRLAGVAPAVALASDNGAFLYVRADVCIHAGSGKRLARCLRRAAPPAPGMATAQVDRATIVAALRTRGLAMTPLGTRVDVLFEGEAHAYSDRITIFELATETEARAEAARIVGDGSLYNGRRGPAHIDWIDAPHFFRAGRVIVLYVGRDARILRILTSTLGVQFAGR